jgi:AcrR family transcriptional regulator
MKRDSATELCGNGADTTTGARTKRLAGPNRRAQVLRTASAQFALTGLNGTKTLTLAKAAGISEAILYAHFGSKTRLFREAVKMNSETRLRSLDSQLFSIAAENQIEYMAEATIMICLGDATNSILMSWALLEAPEFATEVYRNEIGLVRSFWDREIARRFPASRQREIVYRQIVPYAVNNCLAHGLWLATLRHTPKSAESLARQFAISIAKSASTLLGYSKNSLH